MLSVTTTFTVVVATNSEKTMVTTEKINSQPECVTTLITEIDRVIEVDSDGNIVWEVTGLDFPVDVERLENGNTLIVESYEHRVIEVDSFGNIVWEKIFEDNWFPLDAERLDNGNTLIAVPYQQAIIEVNSAGVIVWWTLVFQPWDVEKLDNGNILVADTYRVIEIDGDGNIVWEIAGLENEDAERLDNGNTLLADGITNRVIEIDSDGNIVWEKTGLFTPTDAERLENGNTLIVDTKFNDHRVIEVDSNGDIVWEITGLHLPWDAERLGDNQPPDNPSITGPTSGAVEKEYNYTFVTIDPDEDIVSYYIEWGDDQVEEWIGPYASGEEVIVSHTWSEQGTYTIRAKAKDICGVESEWSEPFIVTISNPPGAPTITGETNGKTGTEYEYGFTSIDPDEDDIDRYVINWDDSSPEETITGPFKSGETVFAKHTWNTYGDYQISAYAVDVIGLQGGDGTLNVIMPRARALLRFFDMFPILQRLLQRLAQ